MRHGIGRSQDLRVLEDEGDGTGFGRTSAACGADDEAHGDEREPDTGIGDPASPAFPRITNGDRVGVPVVTFPRSHDWTTSHPTGASMRRKLLTLGAAIVVVAGIGYSVHAWLFTLRHVSTDDAYVESIIAPLSAKVAGHVSELRVDDNQAVKSGELLLRIDPRDYEAKRDQARAAVAVADASFLSARSDAELARETTRAQADEARAALEGASVAERSSEAAVEESRAKVEAKRAAKDAMMSDVSGAHSSTQQAAKEKERMHRLVQAGYVSQRDFDQADATAATSAATLEATQRRLTVAEREVQQAEAELAGRVLAVAQSRQRVAAARATLSRVESQRHQVALKEAEVGRAEARAAEARADLAYAELQLQYTEVR